MFKNRILGALPAGDIRRLAPHLEAITLAQGQVLCEAGAGIEHIYFIEQGIGSVLTRMTDDRAIEVRMVGREGVIGLAYLLGVEVPPQETIVQVPGTAMRAAAALCKAEFERRETLHRLVLRLVSAALAITSQNAACNRLHSVEQRCARWLLEASNRIGSDTMPMTQEFLAFLLGVRRVGVTATASELRSSGMIEYRRGRLTILDRNALEGRACECYFADHEQFQWEQAPRRRDLRV